MQPDFNHIKSKVGDRRTDHPSVVY